MKITNPTPLLPLPVSGSATKYELLGYVDAHDFVLKCDYAFLAYKETSRDTGEWRVQIKSSQTDGAELDPVVIGLQSLATATQGKTFFNCGYSLEPSAADVRQIEFRVYVVDGNPQEVEIFVRLRQPDHTPSASKSLRFPWPG